MNAWMVFLLGLGSFVVAIIGAVIAIRKLGPEVNKLQVDTSESLVAMAKENADMHRTDAAELRQRNKDLDDRLTAYAEKMGQAMARIEELESKAKQVDVLVAENARLTAENSRLRRERNASLEEVRELKTRVAALRIRIDKLEQG